MKEIFTKRLTLRAFRADDADVLYNYLSDPDTVWFEPYRPLTREEAAREAARRADDQAFIAVCLKNGELIGNLYLGREDDDTCEIGYVFNKAYRGRGYATEAARALLLYAFDELRVSRVVAGCAQKNERSWLLLERLGFARVSAREKEVAFKTLPDGSPAWLDTYHHELTREAFVAR